MAVTVCGLAIAPIKGTRLRQVERVEIERPGVSENRRFYLIDERDRMVNGKQLGELSALVANYSHPDRRLSVTFPDGRVLAGEVELGERVATRFFSRPAHARLVSGAWSSALSDYLGRSVRLVEAAGDAGAVDRRARGAVSLISRASLDRLAEEAGESTVDSRRFRMLIEVEGVRAHQEEQWIGRRLRVGAALLAFAGHVGRCLVTSRDPDTGRVDLPTLDILGDYRRDVSGTEPLPFGIYGRVLETGSVAVGDLASIEG